MQFTKRLREGVRNDTITSSIRIWIRPKVKVSGRYRMEEGQIEVDAVAQISMADITPDLVNLAF